MRQLSSSQNSFSSHTSPGLVWRVSLDLLAHPLAGGPQHRLAEADPLGVVGLVGVDVVALGAVAHRQDVVGEVGGLVPGRGRGDVEAHLLLVGQHLDPQKPSGLVHTGL